MSAVAPPELPEAPSPRRAERAPLLWLALPFMAGLALGRLLPSLPPALPLALALAGSGLALATPGGRSGVWAGALLTALTAAGTASYGLHVGRRAAWENWPVREARLTLRLERVFPSPRPRRCSFLAVVTGAEPHLRELLGQRIYGVVAQPPGQPEPIRSAEIAVVGLLAVVPCPAAPGTLDGRLAGLGLNFRLTRGHLLRAGPPGRYYGALDRLAGRMTALLHAGFEHQPELGAIYGAMMLGQKRDLSLAQRDLFLRSGTMHLFAINGLHIDVVAVSVHALLALLRCPGLAACALVGSVLWLDVSATGNTPSAMRAFIMVGSGEAAQALHRPRRRLAALAAAALLALLIHPLDFFGASFQMSYGVVSVLFTFGLPLAQHWQQRFPTPPDRPAKNRRLFPRLGLAARRWLVGALAVGLAAALVSALTGVEFFGLFVPVGLAANLLVAPFAMLVIVAGVASLSVGLAGGIAASRFFNGAAAVLLRGIEMMIEAAARLPGAAWPAHYRAAWVGPAALAGLIGLCLTGYATGWNPKWGGFWLPIALVALTLALGVRFGSLAVPHP